MANRAYDTILECGCMISKDGGGGILSCDSKNCKYAEWTKTADYKEHIKETKELNTR